MCSYGTSLPETTAASLSPCRSTLPARCRREWKCICATATPTSTGTQQTLDRGRPDGGRYTNTFTVETPKLWWPHGYGNQPLYDLTVVAQSGGSPAEDLEDLDRITRRIGFRRAQLVQEEDRFGRSFYFRINDVDVFAGGSCWVPADSFLPNIGPDEYRKWVELMVEGRQIMTRVWGGGIYEADVFYDVCDELGLLVWQDFAFACATYPTYADYVSSVETEARQNIRRLRDHPSLIIWAGNNEDYQNIERYGLKYDFDDKDPQSWLKTDFPARYFYEHMLPDIVQEESPARYITPAAPGETARAPRSRWTPRWVTCTSGTCGTAT